MIHDDGGINVVLSRAWTRTSDPGDTTRRGRRGTTATLYLGIVENFLPRQFGESSSLSEGDSPFTPPLHQPRWTKWEATSLGATRPHHPPTSSRWEAASRRRPHGPLLSSVVTKPLAPPRTLTWGAISWEAWCVLQPLAECNSTFDSCRRAQPIDIPPSLVPGAALALHVVLLIAAQFMMAMLSIVARRFGSLHKMITHAEAQRTSVDVGRRRRKRATRAGAARVVQRKPKGVSAARTRATCRRIEAWTFILLALSNHVLVNMCSSGRRAAWETDTWPPDAASRGGSTGGMVMLSCNASSADGWNDGVRGVAGQELGRGHNAAQVVHWWAHASRVGEARHPGPFR